MKIAKKHKFHLNSLELDILIGVPKSDFRVIQMSRLIAT